MEPGRKLDALVAEKVMGIQPIDYGTHVGFSHLPHFSTDISIAIGMLLKLQKEDRIAASGLYYDGITWEVTLWFIDEPTLETEADTAAHAICLAALKVTTDNASNPES